MNNVFDCMMSALIESKKRTKAQDDVDYAIKNLKDLIDSGEDANQRDRALEILDDKIGDLMNDEFESGVIYGFQLAVRMMQPLDLV